MGLEIERKFLVLPERWRASSPGVAYRQGYIVTGPPVSVRVRLAGESGYLTIKKDKGAGVRLEFERDIPPDDAKEMLAECCVGHAVEKTRHIEQYEGHTWEVDVFHGANWGLIVAEIELPSPDAVFPMPPWLGPEVTHDPRYLNSYLFEHPYTTWRAQEREREDAVKTTEGDDG